MRRIIGVITIIAALLVMGAGCDTKESTPCKRVGNVYAHSGKVYNCIQGVQGPEWHKVKG